MDQVQEKKYIISKDQRMYYSSVLLLENICNFGHKYSILLDENQKILEPILIHMVSKEWLVIDNALYIPTESGREVLKNYLGRLHEFRSIYKIYASVDTGEGEFAYEKYFDFETDEGFLQYLHEDRFEDLRIAVCEFKGMNPLDIIFMEMVDEERFNCDEIGWEAELATGLIWDEITEIANTNIHVEDLAEEDFTGEEVMIEILEAGNKVLKTLMEEQTNRDNQVEEEYYEGEYEDEEVTYYVEEPIFDDYYYEAYYDPYYVSPYWGVYYY
jgi:hypothetical protein